MPQKEVLALADATMPSIDPGIRLAISVTVLHVK